MDDGNGDGLAQFALALYHRDGVSAACLLLQNRLDLDVNLLLFGAYVGAVRRVALTDTDLTTARERVRHWHSDVVRPLRSVRMRLKNGPPPAPTPATTELRRGLQALEIESEMIELGELDEVAARLVGPEVTGGAAERATLGMVAVVRAAAGRDPDEVELDAIAVIAAEVDA